MKKTIPLILILFGLTFWSFNKTYSQITRVETTLHGSPKSGGTRQSLVAMPLYKTKKKDWFYCEIPSNKFWKNQLNDTLCLLIKKDNKTGKPQEINLLNNKSESMSFEFNSEKGEITFADSDLRVVYHLYDFDSARKVRHNLRIYDTKIDMEVMDTAEWYAVGRQYVKYGNLTVNKKTYSIAIGDKTLDCFFGNGFDKISIDTSLSSRQYANYNARCDNIVNIKYLDFEGEYFRVLKVDPDGNYLDIEKINRVNEDSTIYFDTKVRDNNIIFEDTARSIQSFCEPGKHLLICVVSESNPSHVTEIKTLNRIKEQYSDKLSILYLFEGDQENLKKIKNSYTMTFQTGILTEKARKDLMVMGYPHRVILSPSGEIIKFGNVFNFKLEEFLKEL
jgi:hypothetical protein